MTLSTGFRVNVAPEQEVDDGALEIQMVSSDPRNCACIYRVSGLDAQQYAPRLDPYSIPARLLKQGQQIVKVYARTLFGLQLEAILEANVRVSVKRLGKRDETVVEKLRFGGSQRESLKYAQSARKVKRLSASKFRSLTGEFLFAPGYVGEGIYEAAEPAYGIIVVQYTVEAVEFLLTYTVDDATVKFDVFETEATKIGYEVFDEAGALVDSGGAVPGSAIGGGGSRTLRQLAMRKSLAPDVELFAYNEESATSTTFSPQVEIVNDSSMQRPQQPVYQRRIRQRVYENGGNSGNYVDFETVTDETHIDGSGNLMHRRHER